MLKNKKKASYKKPMRVEPKSIGFLAGLILLLILLFGCTEMTREQKNLCYSLSTKSYAYIPPCTTEDSCFLDVNKLFKTNLGYEQEGKLYSLKNHVGRSWFYYNKAVEQTKKISSLCNAGDASALGGEINQLQFFVEEAFDEIDLAIKESFIIVSIQEKILTNQKIDLVKEEPLYFSLIELRQILSELSAGPTNSDSYVSYYLNRANAFSASAASKGFPSLVESTDFSINIGDFLKGIFPDAPNTGKNIVKFSFIADVLQNAIDYFQGLFFTKQGISALTKFPVSDFMKLYSDLGGNNNSSIKRFADLMSRISTNESATQNNLLGIQKEVNEKYFLAQIKVQQATQTNKYSELYAVLLATNITTQKDVGSQFDEISKAITQLKEKKARGLLALGEELLELKNINAKLDSLLATEQFNEDTIIQKLVSVCGVRAQEIRKEEIVGTTDEIQGMINEVNYFASKTISSDGITRLDYCQELIRKHEELLLALKDYNAFEAQKKDSTKDCFNYLDKVFSFTQLYELQQTYETLKNTEVTQDNLLFFAEACEKIKTQVNLELNDLPEAKKANNDYYSLINELNILQLLSLQYPDYNLSLKIVELQNKLALYSKYFNSNGINFDVFLPVKETIAQTIAKTLQDTKNFVETIITKIQAGQEDTEKIDSIQIIDLNLLLKNKKSDANLTITDINKIFASNSDLISFLYSQLGSEKELIAAKIIPPITQARLAKLELMNSEIINSDLIPQEKQAELMKINQELTNTTDYLKKEAMLAFNKAIDEKAETISLQEAKNNLDTNNYVGAMLALSSARKQSQPLAYFGSFIPIILILAIALIVNYLYKKKQGEEKEKKNIVIENWEDKLDEE